MSETLVLEQALRVAAGLAAAAEADVLQLALPPLEPIDLPPIVGEPGDQARLRQVPPLYLASELETAQLLPAAEALAGVYASGGVDVEGRAGELLLSFWRRRHDRFSADERGAFFARLFGAPGPALAGHGAVNEAFEGLLLGVAQALAELGTPPLPPAEVALRAAASDLAANLTSRTSGIPEPAARTILGEIGEALALFKEQPLQVALGERSPWGALRSAAQRYLRVDAPIEECVSRGKDGMVILSWLAEAVTSLDVSSALREPDAATTAAAVDWIQASLALSRRGAAAAA
jgi:hypothetical protein